MESLKEAEDMIYRELISDDSEIRSDYMKLFSSEAKEFSETMAHAVKAWHAIDLHIKNEESQYVWALVHAAIALHVVSLKLLLSGHTVAAGNLFRQVIESISLALLCSKKNTGVLPAFMNDTYFSNKAVADVVSNWSSLGLNDGAQEQLKVAVKFYHNYSHVTRLTLANLIPSSGQGAYVGAAFDEGRIDVYREEVSRRLGLAKVFVSFIAGVKNNLSQW